MVDFDLAVQSRREGRRFVPLFAAMIFVPILFLVGALSFFLSGDWNSRPDQRSLGITLFVVGLLLVIAVGVLGSKSLFLARTISITENGIDLRYRSGKTQSIVWSDPKLNLTLRDFRVRANLSQAMVRANEAGNLQFGWSLVAWVPGECIDNLFQTAFSKGLAVQGELAYAGTPRAFKLVKITRRIS